MLRIVKSLMVIAVVGAVAVSATGAYFSDTATIAKNTFSTGTLEIRVNGEESILGANFGNMAPGQQMTSDVYRIRNFNPPSNLTAGVLTLKVKSGSVVDDSSNALWNNVKIRVEAKRFFSPNWTVVYADGKLRDLGTVNLLTPLEPAGNFDINRVEQLRYTMWLPDSGANQNTMMGKTLTWDFVVEGRTN